MAPQHDHVPQAPCLPSCPGWAEGALSLFSFQRRYPEMLEACRSAAAIEVVHVAPGTPGTVLPDYLADDHVVRLNLVVGRDTPEVLLDDWGVRCNLTFRGRRFDCAFPWPSILGGVLRPPARRKPRFGVIPGAEDAPGGAGGANGAAGTPRFGVIEGGKGKKE